MSFDPFEGLQPDRILWVDPSAPPGGNGSADWPINTISRAVAKSHPGTAIMVKEGTYVENVYVPRTKDGTLDKPIWLISADGPGMAHIIAPKANMAAIGGGGVQNWIIDGFWTTGGKNGIHFGQNGADYTDMTANIVIRNNFIENPVEDGVKLNGGDNVYVIGNTIVGGRDEGIDLFAINGGIVAYNDVSGNTGTSAAIFAKAGSQNIQILNNYVHDNSAIGISLGGHISPTLDVREGTEDFQVRNIVVTGNVVTNSGKVPLAVLGGHDAVVTGNYFESNPAYSMSLFVGPGNETKNGIAQAKNIEIYDNVLTYHRKGARVADTSENVVLHDNWIERPFVDLSGPAGLAKMLADLESGGGTTPVATPPSKDTNDAPAAQPEVVVPEVVVPEVVAPEVPVAQPVTPAPVQPTPPAAPIPADQVGSFRLIQLKEFLGKEWAESAASVNALRGGTGIGTSANDAISGKAASYHGGAGDDSYTLNAEQAATIVEHANGGIDTLYTTGRRASLVDHVENLVLTSKNGAILTGNSGDNRIHGNVGEDFLLGNGGSNLLQGGAGQDRFVVGLDDKLTRITDLEPGESINIAALQFGTFEALKAKMVEVDGTTIIDLNDGRVVILGATAIANLSASQFSLADGAAVEAARSANVDGVKVAPNSSTNVAFGSDGADQLYGNGSAMLVGGAGDDRYFVMGDGDRVFETSDGGIDTVLLYSNYYAMDAGVENVTAKNDQGITVIGNGLANVIIGGEGDDRIMGGAGADVLTGGGGRDTFVYTSLNDGGDYITDFVSGVDLVDLTALRADQPTATFRMDYSPINGRSTLYATVDGVDHLLASFEYMGKALSMDDLVI